METCIKKSDLIFESVVENADIKKEIHTKINNFMNKESISATGTSGLSINELAKCYTKQNLNRFIGIHFFNPPYNLRLCELIPSNYNSQEFVKKLKEYLEQILNRKVIIVKDKPGFLANNIGFYFINMAMHYAELYKNKGGIDYIDSIIGGITGRNMAPMETADFVGLDVHQAIVDNIYCNQEEDKKSFKKTEYVEYLLSKGLKGVKTNKGLYNYMNDEVFDIKLNQYIAKRKYEKRYIDRAYEIVRVGKYKEAYDMIIENDNLENRILMEMMLKYIIYSLKITNKVGNDIRDCDIAMAEGFNWIPPFALIELLGGNIKVIRYIEKYLKNDEVLEDFNIKSLLDREIKSIYNYRKFIKGMLKNG